MITPWIIVILTVLVIHVISLSENVWIRKLFDWIPAILLAYIIPSVVCLVFSLHFQADSIHTASKTIFIPLAILAVMASLSLSELKSVGVRPLIIFVSGSFFIAAFPVLLIFIGSYFPSMEGWLIQQEQWKGLITVIGSWIGGSISQLVLKEAVECPESIFLSILILDNILVNIWTILMFQFIKNSNKINDWLDIKNQLTFQEIHTTKDNKTHGFNTISILLSITVINYYLNIPFILQIIILSILGMILGHQIKKWNRELCLKISSFLILTIMSILGLKLKIENFHMNVYIIISLCIWLIGHFIFTLWIAKKLDVNVAWVAIGSMANVGGIATAPAVTSAYQPRLMPHAVILAVLSMATGTFWGIIAIWLIQNMIL